MTSIAYNPAAGLTGMLKDGHTHLTGLEATTLKNIEAAKALSSIVSSSYGPNGMNKLVINHLEKIIVTSDCASIVKELEIEHPAAKLLQMAATAQEEECGDATNLTVSFAGELLNNSTELLRMGLHTSEIVEGFKKAGDYLLDHVLPSLAISKIEDLTDEQSLINLVKPVVASKQYGSEDILAPLVVAACLASMGKSKALQSENIRVVKVLGGGISQSCVIHGMAFLRGAEGVITSVSDAKITVFNCGIEASQTEAKGTVLMKDAEVLKSYNKSEENKMHEIIKSIAESGVKIIVTGGSVSEMALHFINKYDLMCLKIGSKWELRRFCTATNSTALVRLGPATPDEMGYCSSTAVKEIGGKHVTVVHSSPTSPISTILLRASTSSTLQDLERAIDDGVNAIQTACRDSRLLPGAGATEIECSLQMKQFGDTCPGLDQYAIRSFAKALEFVPKTLAQNAGHDPSIVLAALTASHVNGNKNVGVDILGDDHFIVDVVSSDDKDHCITDLYLTKRTALKLALDAALTVLKVDQIIMSKPSGGPQK